MAENPIPSPLPADLPTNWTYGQTVAPTGAEAGLATQYGYNYLMAAVNAAQAAINLIGTAFESLPELDGGTIPISQLPAGVAGGVASLDQAGKVPASQLPAMDYLPLAGGNMQGAINMSNYRITNLNTPANAQDAATKAYVDAQVDTRVRIFSVSWIGTGTVGSDNPTSITFPFAPKLVFWPENWDGSYGQYRNIIDATQVTTEYAPQVWFTGSWSTGIDYIKCKRDESGKTFSWYSTAYQGTAAGQMNHSGVKYTLWAIA